MTTQPAAAAFGANSAETAAPAENKADVDAIEIESIQPFDPQLSCRRSEPILPSERSLASRCKFTDRKVAALQESRSSPRRPRRSHRLPQR